MNKKQKESSKLTRSSQSPSMSKMDCEISRISWQESPTARPRTRGSLREADVRRMLREENQPFWASNEYQAENEESGSDKSECFSDPEETNLGVIDAVLEKETFPSIPREHETEKQAIRRQERAALFRSSLKSARDTLALLYSTFGSREEPEMEAEVNSIGIQTDDDSPMRCEPGPSTSMAQSTPMNTTEQVCTPNSRKRPFVGEPLASSTPISNGSQSKQAKLDDSFNDLALDEILTQRVEVAMKNKPHPRPPPRQIPSNANPPAQQPPTKQMSNLSVVTPPLQKLQPQHPIGSAVNPNAKTPLRKYSTENSSITPVNRSKTMATRGGRPYYPPVVEMLPAGRNPMTVQQTKTSLQPRPRGMPPGRSTVLPPARQPTRPPIMNQSGPSRPQFQTRLPMGQRMQRPMAPRMPQQQAIRPQGIHTVPGNQYNPRMPIRVPPAVRMSMQAAPRPQSFAPRQPNPTIKLQQKSVSDSNLHDSFYDDEDFFDFDNPEFLATISPLDDP